MFYDNSGNFQGQASQSDATLTDSQGNLLFNFNSDRGDDTRIASHINSNYVFLAGKNVGGSVPQVRVAVWDARTQNFVGSVNVSELSAANGGTDAADFQPAVDRTSLAVDALNRVLVTYALQPDSFTVEQVAARVLAFDGTTGHFRYLTPSFFPMINHDTANSGIATPVGSYNPSASMTTTALLIAVKGLPNSLNVPALGTDMPGDTNFYTVISHPDPQPDPTPPVP
jgi:hypothetical protein